MDSVDKKALRGQARIFFNVIKGIGTYPQTSLEKKMERLRVDLPKKPDPNQSEAVITGSNKNNSQNGDNLQRNLFKDMIRTGGKKSPVKQEVIDLTKGDDDEDDYYFDENVQFQPTPTSCECSFDLSKNDESFEEKNVVNKDCSETLPKSETPKRKITTDNQPRKVLCVVEPSSMPSAYGRGRGRGRLIAAYEKMKNLGVIKQQQPVIISGIEGDHRRVLKAHDDNNNNDNSDISEHSENSEKCENDCVNSEGDHRKIVKRDGISSVSENNVSDEYDKFKNESDSGSVDKDSCDMRFKSHPPKEQSKISEFKLPPGFSQPVKDKRKKTKHSSSGDSRHEPSQEQRPSIANYSEEDRAWMSYNWSWMSGQGYSTQQSPQMMRTGFEDIMGVYRQRMMPPYYDNHYMPRAPGYFRQPPGLRPHPPPVPGSNFQMRYSQCAIPQLQYPYYPPMVAGHKYSPHQKWFHDRSTTPSSDSGSTASDNASLNDSDSDLLNKQYRHDWKCAKMENLSSSDSNNNSKFHSPPRLVKKNQKKKDDQTQTKTGMNTSLNSTLVDYSDSDNETEASDDPWIVRNLVTCKSQSSSSESEIFFKPKPSKNLPNRTFNPWQNKYAEQEGMFNKPRFTARGISHFTDDNLTVGRRNRPTKRLSWNYKATQNLCHASPETSPVSNTSISKQSPNIVNKSPVNTWSSFGQSEWRNKTPDVSPCSTSGPRRYSFESPNSVVSSPVDYLWKQRYYAKLSMSDVKFIDSHCHIDFIFNQSKHQGTWSEYKQLHADTFMVNYAGCVTNFCDPRTYRPNGAWVDILKEDQVWGAFGCHPKCASEFSDDKAEFLRRMMKHPKVVALGEIGLDYSKQYFLDQADLQKQVFIKQLKIAIECKKPLVIHCRGADVDCIDIMKQYVPQDYPIHRHCFTEDWEVAEPWLKHFSNLYLGFTALLTYPKARIHDVVRRMPIDRILLETDAPYFVPSYVPKDEVKISHPGMALCVAYEVARQRQLPIDDVLHILRQNTRKMYNV